MVSDERALAVRLASTERRRPRPDVRGPRRRRLRPVARLLRRRRGTAGSRVRRARASHGSPARRSSPCSPPSTAPPCPHPSSRCCDPSRSSATTARRSARSRHACGRHPSPVPTHSSPNRPLRPSSRRTTPTPPLRPSAPSRPSARWPTCCSRACTRPCRAPAPVRSAPSTGGDSRMPAPWGRWTTSTTWSPPPQQPASCTPLGREWIVTDARRRSGSKRPPRRALGGRSRRGCAAPLPAGLRTDDGGFRPLSSWAGAYPLHAEWTGTRRPAAPHRRSLGPDHRGRHRAAVDARRCGPAPRPTPTAWRRTCPPRSTASTCRPT